MLFLERIYDLICLPILLELKVESIWSAAIAVTLAMIDVLDRVFRIMAL